MSFLGGAECSTAGNPLTQFTKHVQDDKSLQRDRMVGRGPGGPQESMRSMGMVGGQDQMMDDFLQQTGQIPQDAPPFAMEQMRREVERLDAQQMRAGSPGWASEFNKPGVMDEHPQITAKNSGFSPAEFMRWQRMRAGTDRRTASPITNDQSMGSTNTGYRSPMAMGYGMNYGMGGMGMGMGMMNQPYGPMSPGHQEAMEGKGKERMVELDDINWEQQFKELDAAGQQFDTDEEANAAMERELNDIDRSVNSDANEFGNFERVWKGIETEIAASRDILGDDNLNVRESMHMGDFDQWDGFDSFGRGNLRDPQLGDYLFEEENLFKDVGDPFGEGMRIMQEGGNLSLAALAFEAAVQKDPQHVEAWSMLGQAQAQNEKESPAIRALEQALKLDPSNLPALMGLAVSYTNEGYDSTAYRTLERWLATKYPQIVDASNLTPEADIGFTDRHQLHEKVTNLFIQAAQLSPAGEAMDPDVQVGLGVLFYGAEEYEKAVDCFSAALDSTASGASKESHQLHLLWNRLGATLANSGRSEEAIAAYERALTINPNFVRARYNLGVSCINIGCYEEAAQHLLGALAMHKVVAAEGRQRAKEVVGDGVGDEQLERMIQQNQSTNLYDTLRRVFSQMGRRDLSEMVAPGMDVDVFRGEFEF